MTDTTLTRSGIADAINRSVGLSRADCGRLVEEILSEIGDALARGETVKLSGFGSFILRDKRQRTGRNPKTGVEVPITPRRVVGFRPAQSVRERVAKA